jgi:hypothetical protein
MSSSIWIANLLILAAVLEADLGRRRVWWWRVTRPLIATAIVVPLFVKSPQGSGNGLLFELALAAGGLLFGLILSVGLMKVGRDQATGELMSTAGFAYGAAWVLIIGARLIFSYGSNHWYSQDVGRWLHTSRITTDGLTDGLILMAIMMALTRTGRLAVALYANNKTMEATTPEPEGAGNPEGRRESFEDVISGRPIHRLLSHGPIHQLMRARRMDRASSVGQQGPPDAPV